MEIDAVGTCRDGLSVVDHPDENTIFLVEFQSFNQITVAGSGPDGFPSSTIVVAEQHFEMIYVVEQVGVGGPLDGGASVAGVR